MLRRKNIKSLEEIEYIRQSALLVSKTLGMLAIEITPGVTTLHLDTLAEMYIRDHGAKPAFLGYNKFPNSLCISVNEQVVHGVPSHYELKEGDMISIDCGTYMNGYYGDHAYSFGVGELKPEVKKLLDITKESLYHGIAAFRAGQRIGDIGHAVQTHVEKYGYGVVRDLVGHGLGRNLHEPPQVPNFGRRGSGPALKDGMVLAIEPMINMGTKNVRLLNDKWTIVTADQKPSAHFEHDVAMINGKPEILSTFDYIYEALGMTVRQADEIIH